MSTLLHDLHQHKPLKRGVPRLEPGDHLDQKTFHERYEALPNGARAELVGGVVFMPSPLKADHCETNPELIGWLLAYKAATPGTRVLDNATIILGPAAEPQPDACLIIGSGFGGQTQEVGGYVTGAPEFAAEVASSSESYDLHSKKADYERAGVREYLVVKLREPAVVWFVLRSGRFEPLSPGPDGIFRSEFFPGLWLDPDALLRRDTNRVLEILRQGLATPGHAAWTAKLAGA